MEWFILISSNTVARVSHLVSTTIATASFTTASWTQTMIMACPKSASYPLSRRIVIVTSRKRSAGQSSVARLSTSNDCKNIGEVLLEGHEFHAACKRQAKVTYTKSTRYPYLLHHYLSWYPGTRHVRYPTLTWKDLCGLISNFSKDCLRTSTGIFRV